jgi:YD repeat-containing protein
MAVDTKMGTYTSKALDGTTTVTKIFNTPGPLYQKVRSVEKTTSDGQTSIIYKASYDEAGRLVRNMDPNGFVVTYDYNNEGQETARHTVLPNDPGALRKIKEKESLLLSALNNAPLGAKDTYIEKLAIFYVYGALNADKANALIQLVTEPDLVYRIKLAIIEGDPDATETQKATRLKPLLKAFPYRADQLNMLIQMHEGTYVDKQ